MDIKNICANYGLNTEYLRKEELATDTIGKIDVIRDILEWHEQTNHTKYDYILDLDVTSPLRTVSDLNNALSIIQSDPEALNLFSVSSAKKNPYFNMVEQKDNGYFGLVKKENEYLTRQSAPKVYELNASFYFYRRTFFEKGYKSTITDRSLIYEVPHICFDLDHPVDFDFLSFLIENNKLDFEL
jgi:CMP-N-acetylneuraminic acid synthetase